MSAQIKNKELENIRHIPVDVRRSKTKCQEHFSIHSKKEDTGFLRTLRYFAPAVPANPNVKLFSD